MKKLLVIAVALALGSLAFAEGTVTDAAKPAEPTKTVKVAKKGKRKAPSTVAPTTAPATETAPTK
jgi:hypothetical protein